MAKLNKDIRAEIVNNAIEKSPVPMRQAAYDKRHAAWVEKCRIESLGGAKEVARIMRAMAKAEKVMTEIPSEHLNRSAILNTDYEIYLNVAGCAYHAYFPRKENGDRCRLPCVNGTTRDRFVIEAGSPLAVEFFELEQERSVIEGIEASIRTQAEAAVSSCTTVKRLLEVWPEVVELIPRHDASVAEGLPSVNVQELNTLIGLPTE